MHYPQNKSAVEVLDYLSRWCRQRQQEFGQSAHVLDAAAVLEEIRLLRRGLTAGERCYRVNCVGLSTGRCDGVRVAGVDKCRGFRRVRRAS